MLDDRPGPEAGKYSWHCLLCDSFGYRGGAGYEQHYETTHRNGQAATYLDFLKEARSEHKLGGAAAYEWAHAAWVEHERNQR